MEYQIYWKDRLRSWCYEQIPYRLNRVVGYEDKDGLGIEGAMAAFRGYLIQRRAIPDKSSGEVVKLDGKTYYYIQCHVPLFWARWFPIRASDGMLIDEFIQILPSRLQ